MGTASENDMAVAPFLAVIAKEAVEKLAKVEAELAKVEAKLADSSFVEKVPAPVLEDHRQRQAKWAEKLETLKTTLKALG
jgi:valyl-tRNA synthetase